MQYLKKSNNIKFRLSSSAMLGTRLSINLPRPSGYVGYVFFKLILIQQKVIVVDHFRLEPN